MRYLQPLSIHIDVTDLNSLLARLEEVEVENPGDADIYVRVPRVLASGEDSAEYLDSDECPRRFRYMQFGDEVIVEVMTTLARETIVPELFVGLSTAFDKTFPNAPPEYDLSYTGRPTHSYISKTTKLKVSKQPDGAIWPPEVVDGMIPSVVVKVGQSEKTDKLLLSLEWWKEKARTALEAGKLVNIDKKNKRMTYYFHPAPEFDIDSNLTTVVPLDDTAPGPMQLAFRLEWLYEGRIPV